MAVLAARWQFCGVLGKRAGAIEGKFETREAATLQHLLNIVQKILDKRVSIVKIDFRLFFVGQFLIGLLQLF